MSRKIRRETGAAGLSFLDCICCGFGAVILLLVIVKVHVQPPHSAADEALYRQLAAAFRANPRAAMEESV